MSRLPAAALTALALATIGAFFVTQHLKVTTPLIAGIRAPAPGVINPRGGAVCDGVDHRGATISFYLLHRADDVDVYVTDQAGTIVRTLASGRHMRRAVRNPDGDYRWNGREDNGAVAPDGTYLIEVALIHQGRTVILSNASGPLTIRVLTRKPQPVVEGVSPHLVHGPGTPVRIRYSGNFGNGVSVLMYRTDVPGPPRLAKAFRAAQSAVWDGRIRERPAPAGIYLVGLSVTDAACDTVRVPRSLPPPPGSTPGAGVTVRYVAATPPLEPVPAGTAAPVVVDAGRRPYRWSLRRAGATLTTGGTDQPRLEARLPDGRPGLYELDLRTGPHATAVPLVASASAPAPVLVVLPALTWQGLNPVDETGDGLPDTLDTARVISLRRPLSQGLPAGFSDEAALLAYLDATHRSYQLTTDLGLIESVGPALAGHRAVILAGSERWLPAATAAALRSYTAGGGHLLSLGTGSLLRQVAIRGGQALDPTGPAAHDGLGARAGDSGVAAFQLGRGTVTEIRLPGFGSSLGRDAGARALLNRLWKGSGA